MTPSSGPWVPGISRYHSDSLALSAPPTAEFTPGRRGGPRECAGCGAEASSLEAEQVIASLPNQLPLEFG